MMRETSMRSLGCYVVVWRQPRIDGNILSALRSEIDRAGLRSSPFELVAVQATSSGLSC